jgi:hypothetical protein
MMADTLETFAPVARTVTVAGCEIAVLPVRMKNLAAFSGGVRPAMPLIMAGALAAEGAAKVAEMRAALKGLAGDLDGVAGSLSKTFADSLGRGLSDFVAGTKSAGDAFADFAGTVLREINKVIAQRFTNAFITPLIDGLISFLPFADGGVPGAPGLSVWSDRVIDKPIAFPMPGEPGQIGIAGEAGKEAILPLRSGPGGEGVLATDPDGRIGVLALRRTAAPAAASRGSAAKGCDPLIGPLSDAFRAVEPARVTGQCHQHRRRDTVPPERASGGQHADRRCADRTGRGRDRRQRPPQGRADGRSDVPHLWHGETAAMSTRIWPDTLPGIIEPGFGLRPAEQSIRTDMEVGTKRLRRISAARADSVTVGWKVTDREIAAFRAGHGDEPWSLAGASDDVSGRTADGVSVTADSAVGPAWQRADAIVETTATAAHRIARDLPAVLDGDEVQICATLMGRGRQPLPGLLPAGLARAFRCGRPRDAGCRRRSARRALGVRRQRRAPPLAADRHPGRGRCGADGPGRACLPCRHLDRSRRCSACGQRGGQRVHAPRPAARSRPPRRRLLPEGAVMRATVLSVANLLYLLRDDRGMPQLVVARDYNVTVAGKTTATKAVVSAHTANPEHIAARIQAGSLVEIEGRAG